MISEALSSFKDLLSNHRVTWFSDNQAVASLLCPAA